MDRLFLIDEKEEGLSPDFSKLVSMMNYARHTTIRAVEDLSVEDLDFTYDEKGNTIGMLLAHMAAVERIYQYLTLGDHTDEEVDAYAETLEPALSLGDAGRALKGKRAEEYIRELEIVREETIAAFKNLPDEWLYEEKEWWQGKQANRYFMWFHVFEDEINHRGQIRIIKKMAQSVSAG
ncbi:DinB family protein [Fictibacillus aquaticus]